MTQKINMIIFDPEDGHIMLLRMVGLWKSKYYKFTTCTIMFDLPSVSFAKFA